MTLRQSILKATYPVLMKAGNLFGLKTATITNSLHAKPAVSFYQLQAIANNNSVIKFSSFTGKKIMLVNIASECGYTNQLSELQKLQDLQKDSLIIIGFPANDFKEQEKGSDEEIASFCQLNYGVQFLLMKKSVVVKSPDQNNVYKWLTDKQQNGWNNKPPEWNFAKYLVNEQGILTHYFGPAVSPISKKILEALS
ncbi:MAG TPA: glutathione peroxidase [Segetibacter sp.]|jgi:glutathione peroxidase